MSWVCWQAVNHGGRRHLRTIAGNVPPLESLRMKIGKERIWYFGKFDEASWQGTGVHVYSYDEKGSDSYRIRARIRFAGWKRLGLS